MKTCYIDESTRSIVDLVAPGELTPGWTISRINVPREHRGKRLGSSMLARVVSAADAEGADLWLEPHPTGALDYDQLVAWYRRYGFKFHRTGYMVRRSAKSH